MIVVRDIGFRSSAAILEFKSVQGSAGGPPSHSCCPLYGFSNCPECRKASPRCRPHRASSLSEPPLSSQSTVYRRNSRAMVMPAAPPATIHRSSNTDARKLVRESNKHSVFAYTPNPIGKRITSQECKKLSQLQMVTPSEAIGRYSAAARERNDRYLGGCH